MPHATIIVPAYNATSTLPATLASLLTQTYDDYEIVVVDDGSTDETADIIRAFAANHPRIRLVSQRNRGLAGARNSGIAAARGDIIGFCDADDLWHNNKLAAHVEHFKRAPHVGLSYAGSRLIDANGAPTGHSQRPRLQNFGTDHIFKRHPVGNGSAPVFRRAALQAIAWRPAFETERDWVFDETFRQSEDIECWLRLALRTDWAIEGVPGLLTEYRINPNGLSANTERQLASWEHMVSKLRPYSPSFFARHENAARAYQLRYLARRAVCSGDAGSALSLVRRSLATSLAPLAEEPAKTLTTLAAALALSVSGDRFLRLASILKSPHRA